MKIYVGNLAVHTSLDEIKRLFSEHGKVAAVHRPVSCDSAHSGGCASVTMESAEAVAAAMAALDGYELHGRKLKLKEVQVPV